MAVNNPSGSSIAEAITSYKKKPGKLVLSTTALKWIPKDGAGSGAEIISIDCPRLQSLFSSKEGGPKAMLKIGAKAISTGPPSTNASDPSSAADESYNLSFTGSDMFGDREIFKKYVTEIILQNRAKGQAVGGPSHPADGQTGPPKTTTEDSRIPPDKGKAVNPLEDWRLKKRVLQNHPELRQLHKEMVIGGQISEGEFWDGREELLYHEARLDAQKTGRSAQMVDPRPETTDSGEIRISITPQMIRDIFEQYPVVQRAYNENVPPLNDQTFWTRYFRSKLFNRHRSSARQSGDAVKEDEIFDKYLGDDDDGIEPKQINTREVFKLLDLAATQEDHVETGNSNDWTMRAGTQRSSLPLMRRFNEHSQRLLDSSLGKIPERRCGGVIDGGDAGSRNYYEETDLEDLNAQAEPERIVLDMREQERYFEGSAAASSQNSKRKRTASEDEQTVEQMGRVTNAWRLELEKFRIPKDDVNQSTRLIKLRRKSFPWFDLTEEVFSGAVASGSMADRIFPAATPCTSGSILTGEAPAEETSGLRMKGLTAAMKRQLAALDEDDNQEDTTSTDHQPSSSKRKRTRESKTNIVGEGIQGLISAIDKASEGSKDLVGAMVSIASHRTPHQDQYHLENHPVSQTASEDALDKLREQFMTVISEEDYVDYVGVLENENKARTFLKLINTTTFTICHKWIHKESMALKSSI